jgi:hypothetical protein
LDIFQQEAVMDREDKLEKLFNYSIGCLGLLSVLATVIALFITLSRPSVVIRFIEEYADFPTMTPVVIVITPKPPPTYTPYPTYTPLPTYTPWIVISPQKPLPTYTPYPTYTPLPTYTPWRMYITPPTPPTAMPSPTPTFEPSSATVASTEELRACENKTVMNRDKNLFIAFNKVDIDTKQVSGIISSPGYPNLEIKNLGVGDRVLYHGKKWYEIRIKSIYEYWGEACADVIVVSFEQ